MFILQFFRHYSASYVWSHQLKLLVQNLLWKDTFCFDSEHSRDTNGIGVFFDGFSNHLTSRKNYLGILRLIDIEFGRFIMRNKDFILLLNGLECFLVIGDFFLFESSSILPTDFDGLIVRTRLLMTPIKQMLFEFVQFWPWFVWIKFLKILHHLIFLRV